MKVVINSCFGGFGLSHEAVMRYAELAGLTLYPSVEKRTRTGDLVFNRYIPYNGKNKVLLIFYSTKPLNDDGTFVEKTFWSDDSIERHDPLLIQVVEELGEKANGDFARLKVVEIPDGIEYEIDEYDGSESINEVHRSWS